jgi:hypothetical protein
MVILKRQPRQQSQFVDLGYESRADGHMEQR